jgi:hypothetical protein
LVGSYLHYVIDDVKIVVDWVVTGEVDIQSDVILPVLTLRLPRLRTFCVMIRVSNMTFTV